MPEWKEKKNSHPIASTDSAAGIRGVNASARASLKHLAARAGDGARLGSSRRSGNSRVHARSTGLLIILRVGLTSSLGNGLGVLLVLVNSPVEDVIVLETLADEEITEDLAEIAVVGLVVEAQRSSVVEVDGELVGESAAKNLGGSSHLLLHDTIILLLLSSSLQTLPRERTTAEVEHNITQRLHVVTTRLLNTKMGVDGGITGSASQVLVLSVWDVEVGLGITVLLGKTKIDNVDLVSTLPNAHKEVVGLDISVNERLGVDVLNTRNELISKEKDSLQGKFAVAEVEEVFQAGAKKVENHGVVITLGAKPADKGNTNAAGK